MPPGVRFTGWQLSFAGLTGGRIAAPPVLGAERPACEYVGVRGQLALFECDRDFTRFSVAHQADPDNPTLIAARRVARLRGEAHGWSHWLATEVDRGMVILLSQHIKGDRIRYSQITPLDRLSVNVSRTAGVLAELDLLIDDRPDTLGSWVERKFAELAPGIAVDVRGWITALRTGEQRTQRHSDQTVRHYLKQAHPHLVAWSAEHDHLREITSNHILHRVAALHGMERKRVIVALRSLFAFAHRTRRIFRNPAARIRPGIDGARLPRRMTDEQLRRLDRAAMTPIRRLLVALTAIHAARPIQLTKLTLDDVDLPNRRLTIGDKTRRIDDLTHRLLLDYLRYRQQRWPRTSNHHLLLTEQRGHDQDPVSTYWLNCEFRAIGATPTQLRMDRQLEEALTHGPDPLHLVAVFGIAENTAVRYARAAHQLLETNLEVEQ